LLSQSAHLILAGLLVLALSFPASAGEKPEPILWFVSFSMPEASLRQAVAQAEKTGAVLLIRGLKGDSFLDTAKAIAVLVGEKEVQFQIDPPLFREYGITSVPCVCYKGVKVCGDVSLDYALEFIGAKEASAKEYVNKLRWGYYD